MDDTTLLHSMLMGFESSIDFVRSVPEQLERPTLQYKRVTKTLGYLNNAN